MIFIIFSIPQHFEKFQNLCFPKPFVIVPANCSMLVEKFGGGSSLQHEFGKAPDALLNFYSGFSDARL